MVYILCEYYGVNVYVSWKKKKLDRINKVREIKSIN